MQAPHITAGSTYDSSPYFIGSADYSPNAPTASHSKQLSNIL